MHADSPGPLITLECLPSGKATMSSKKHHTNSKLIYKIMFPVRIKHDPLWYKHRRMWGQYWNSWTYWFQSQLKVRIGKHQPAVKSVHFPKKSTSCSVHFCHHSMCLKFPCSILPFQKFVNNNEWLPGLPHWFHSAGLPLDALWRRTDGSPRELGTECKVDVEEVPSHSSEFSTCIGERCGTECCHMAGWFFFSPWTFFMQCTTNLWSGKGNKPYWWFPLVENTQQICILQHPKRELA